MLGVITAVKIRGFLVVKKGTLVLNKSSLQDKLMLEKNISSKVGVKMAYNF